MGNRPFISFCFTTFNRHDYLKSTLEGIKAQTFSDYEVIVSDNDPGGSAGPVVALFDPAKFKYFPNGENLGMKQSYNKSLERSTGQFIVMIADDDPVYPDMLETLYDLYHKHPGYGMYLGGCNWFCTEPELAMMYNCKVGVNSCLANKSVNTIDIYTGSEFLKRFYNFKIFPHCLWSTGMVKRDILVSMGGIPDYGTPFLGDYAYLSIMGGHSGCVTINKALGHQTLHNENFGRNQYDQLLIVAPNFVEYVSARLSHIQEWEEIKQKMLHFVGVWLIRHLAFLKSYNRSTGNTEGMAKLEAVEQQILALPLIQPYRTKYLLLTKVPWLHDKIVVWKKALSRSSG